MSHSVSHLPPKKTLFRYASAFCVHSSTRELTTATRCLQSDDVDLLDWMALNYGDGQEDEAVLHTQPDIQRGPSPPPIIQDAVFDRLSQVSSSESDSEADEPIIRETPLPQRSATGVKPVAQPTTIPGLSRPVASNHAVPDEWQGIRDVSQHLEDDGMEDNERNRAHGSDGTVNPPPFEEPSDNGEVMLSQVLPSPSQEGEHDGDVFDPIGMMGLDRRRTPILPELEAVVFGSKRGVSRRKRRPVVSSSPGHVWVSTQTLGGAIYSSQILENEEGATIVPAESLSLDVRETDGKDAMFTQQRGDELVDNLPLTVDDFIVPPMPSVRRISRRFSKADSEPESQPQNYGQNDYVEPDRPLCSPEGTVSDSRHCR